MLTAVSLSANFWPNDQLGVSVMVNAMSGLLSALIDICFSDDTILS